MIQNPEEKIPSTDITHLQFYLAGQSLSQPICSPAGLLDFQEKTMTNLEEICGKTEE